jgi:hypothetical protein
MKNTAAIVSSVILLVLLSALCVSGQKDQKNEPEMLIKAARFLEEKPFNKDAKNIRSWAIIWITQTDKVSVTVCSLLLSNPDKKYKYDPEILGQYTIGMAAFKLSNPEKATDENAAQLAGVESALTSYEAMVKEQPKARNAFLDDLVAKRAAESWATYVAEHNCKGKN